jgi:hypothetical protein
MKNWETRHANALKSLAESAKKLTEDVKDVPLPPDPKPTTTKKTYEERLHEIKLQIRKTVGELGYLFIPELCELLKEEHPEFSNKSIQEQVIEDCSDIWERSSIYVYLPSWVHNQKQVQAAKKRWETKNADKVKNLKNVFKISEKIDLQEPTLPISTTKEDTKDEQFDQTLQELGVAPYGETGKSTMTLTSEISEHAYKLFAALTNNDSPPDESDDLIVDYIKPSREFRKGLMLEVDKDRRTEIHNALHYASVAIEDMIEIINDIDK